MDNPFSRRTNLPSSVLIRFTVPRPIPLVSILRICLSLGYFCSCCFIPLSNEGIELVNHSLFIE